MGAPVLVEVEGRKVWTCCAACPPKLKASPARYLARLEPPPRDGVLSVPESAVIDTGALTMVYVEADWTTTGLAGSTSSVIAGGSETFSGTNARGPPVTAVNGPIVGHSLLYGS